MKREKQPKTRKTKKLIKQESNKEKGITLIALVITIIVLIILAGISISLVLGQNGLFNRAKNAAIETAKARFLEDAGFAYSEAYIEKAEKSDSNAVTIDDIVSKLKSSYGYTDEQIKTLSSGVSDITLNETEITLEPGQTKEIAVDVTLEGGTYYALIEGLYYPITLSNTGITLGEGVANLQTGDEETLKAEATLGSEKVEVTVVGTTITIKAKEGQEQAVEETVTVTYGESISKEIKVKIKVRPKQGEIVDLGAVKVTVNGAERTLVQSWKYFYDDSDNNKVWLIYDGILEKVAQQVGGTIKVNDNNNVCSPSNRQDLIDYLNGTGSYANQWDYIKTGIKNVLNLKLSAKKITIDESQIGVKGSPDVVLFQQAYNQMYPGEKFEVQSNGTEYQYRFGETGSFANSVTVPNYKSKTLFCIESDYWLISLSGRGGNVNIVNYTNFDSAYYFALDAAAARPVVSIPTSVFDQLIS